MTSSSLVKRVIGALIGGVIGLTMVLYALEQSSLRGFAAGQTGAVSRPPLSVYVTLFIGLVAVSLSAYWAFQQWTAYVREHSGVLHLPVWFLVPLLVLPGGALVYSIATHSSYLESLDQVPAEPNLGYVAFQVVMAALTIISGVLLAARWSTDPKRQLPRA